MSMLGDNNMMAVEDPCDERHILVRSLEGSDFGEFKGEVLQAAAKVKNKEL
jgi:hypothetical protein